MNNFFKGRFGVTSVSTTKNQDNFTKTTTDSEKPHPPSYSTEFVPFLGMADNRKLNLDGAAPHLEEGEWELNCRSKCLEHQKRALDKRQVDVYIRESENVKTREGLRKRQEALQEGEAKPAASTKRETGINELEAAFDTRRRDVVTRAELLNMRERRLREEKEEFWKQVALHKAEVEVAATTRDRELGLKQKALDEREARLKEKENEMGMRQSSGFKCEVDMMDLVQLGLRVRIDAETSRWEGRTLITQLLAMRPEEMKAWSEALKQRELALANLETTSDAQQSRHTETTELP